MKEEPKKVIIYEVLRIMNKKGLFLKEHFQRMENSFKLINKQIPFTFEDVNKKIEEAIKAKDNPEGNIKITYDIDSKELNAFYIPHSYPTKEMYDEGVKIVFYSAERENPNAKIINDDLRKKAIEEAKANNAYEVVLIDRNGNITEGSKSNIFMVKDGVLMTSPGNHVLPGVTRMKLLEIAKNLNIPIKEIEYNYTKVNELDGMFISGTSPQVLPIRHAGDIELNVKNEIILKLMKGYQEVVKENIS